MGVGGRMSMGDFGCYSEWLVQGSGGRASRWYGELVVRGECGTGSRWLALITKNPPILKSGMSKCLWHSIGHIFVALY